MAISSIPIPAQEGKQTELRISMECATNECLTSLRLIAEYAAKHRRADAHAVVGRIVAVSTIIARFMKTRHPFTPGPVSRRVEKKYEDISIAMTALAEEVRERDYRAAMRTVRKIQEIATSVSLLLQVETN